MKYERPNGRATFAEYPPDYVWEISPHCGHRSCRNSLEPPARCADISRRNGPSACNCEPCIDYNFARMEWLPLINLIEENE